MHDSSCAGAPWVELTKEHDIKWEPSWQDKYTGPQGGAPDGPTQFIVDIVRSAKGLADIFFAILPLDSLRESLNSQGSIATMIG